MDTTGAQRHVLLQHRRWAAGGTIALLAMYAGLDLARGIGPAGYAARAAWIIAVAVCGALQRPGRPRVANAAARVIGLVAGVCATVLVGAYGSENRIYFGFLLAVPFCTLALVPDLPSSALGAGLATTVGGLVLLSRQGRPVSELVEWVALSAVINLLASWATILYGRLWRRELSAERARADAIADLRASEERLQKSERLAALGTLAAGVAHEINNPLAYMRANLCWTREAVEQRMWDRDELRRVLLETERGTERIARIVAELSAYARGREEPRATDVAAVVDEAIRMSAPKLGSGFDLSVEVARDLPRVSVVARHLSQALVNLLANAAEAIEARVAREQGAPRRIAVRVTADGDFVAIAVEDSGTGLGEETLAHLFEPFFTTKGPLGTGLGLAISRENLTRFGASIEAARSALGGARFRVRVPVGPDEVEELGPLDSAAA